MTLRPIYRWEWTLVGGATLLALLLGFSNLGKPSLWHDELVHVFVAKSIAATGEPLLPSGKPYASGAAFNYLLGGAIALFGDSERAVRAPSVIIHACNVLLTFLVLRSLLGKGPALVAAYSLALSPWTVAWSREANFYCLQQFCYVLFVGATWRLTESVERKRLASSSIAAACTYLLGVFSSFHSILFLACTGCYAFVRLIHNRNLRSRWLGLCIATLVVGGATYAIYRMTFSWMDYEVLVRNARFGALLFDSAAPQNYGGLYYYFRFLFANLSTGYYLLALFGFAAMIVREGRQGVFVALAFWAPVLVLTFLIIYRMHRFMYFAYPFYIAGHAYGLIVLVSFLRTANASWRRSLAAILVLAFLGVLSLSTGRLVADSLEVAKGSHETLARLHPRWREPCAYVRQHAADAAVVSTTYLPALYYVGRCDSWFPSRTTRYEAEESGFDGLAGVDDLERFMREHPKGYYIAEYHRLHLYRNDKLKEDVDWVEKNLRYISEASNEDVLVYSWGI